jgi:hypothetical protein
MEIELVSCHVVKQIANNDYVYLCMHLDYIQSVKSTYNLGPSPPAIVLKHLTSLPSTQLFLTLS